VLDPENLIIIDHTLLPQNDAHDAA